MGRAGTYCQSLEPGARLDFTWDGRAGLGRGGLNFKGSKRQGWIASSNFQHLFRVQGLGLGLVYWVGVGWWTSALFGALVHSLRGSVFLVLRV